MSRVPLRPMIVPGPFWRRHRHYLVPDDPLDSRGPYDVLDATTGRRYAWDIWPPGSTTIGVPTTWAYTRRGWTSRAYYLVPSPERERHADGRPTEVFPGIVGRAWGWFRRRLI